MISPKNKHSQTLVPIETWCYASPDEAIKWNRIDLWLFAESLLYYDKSIIAPSTPDIFYELLNYFSNKNQLDIFYKLFEDKIVWIYDHAFISTAVYNDWEFSIWNIQDPIQERPNTFRQRYLYNPKINEILPKARYRKRLYSALEWNFMEGKASDFEAEINDAREDFGNNKRNAVIVQALVDNIYSTYNLGKAPDIAVKIDSNVEWKYTITWNIDFNELNQLTWNKLWLHLWIPFTALANGNKLIWTASKLWSDLYLPSPMSQLVGNKLQESLLRIDKPQWITNILKDRVGFPDIRNLVNSWQLDFHDVMRIRKEAKKFRLWLQEEWEKDRDAILAYQNEFIEAVWLEKLWKKAYNIFWVFWWWGTIWAVVWAAISPEPILWAAIWWITTGFIDYLWRRLDTDWRPIVFWNWTSSYVKNKIQE